eukprot:TRINITY_DN707_c0_g1_i14.p2 TRINITY_DN707_c0_g1~~TRINITY_DN707_c0_g1_i14.p2  ORF type:complete len:146 (-),score=2.49 TRINITY_DN707_c0_g1_i14:320-757(-)
MSHLGKQIIIVGRMTLRMETVSQVQAVVLLKIKALILDFPTLTTGLEDFQRIGDVDILVNDKSQILRIILRQCKKRQYFYFQSIKALKMSKKSFRANYSLVRNCWVIFRFAADLEKRNQIYTLLHFEVYLPFMFADLISFPPSQW